MLHSRCGQELSPPCRAEKPFPRTRRARHSVSVHGGEIMGLRPCNTANKANQERPEKLQRFGSAISFVFSYNHRQEREREHMRRRALEHGHRALRDRRRRCHSGSWRQQSIHTTETPYPFFPRLSPLPMTATSAWRFTGIRPPATIFIF